MKIVSSRDQIISAFIVAGSIILATFILLSGGCRTAHASDGYATYYTIESAQSEGTSGVFTANGERYNENAMTCALPIRLKYGHSGKSYLACGPAGCAEVRQNDLGPGKKSRKNGTIIDLSPRAFKSICGDLRQGKCFVGVQEIQ